jgi:serine/threonine-protein kinase
VAVLIGVIVALIFTTDIGGGNGASAEFVEVDGVIGRPFNEAEFILTAKGFKVERRVKDSNQPPDVVLDQDPSPGENFEKGKTVRLTVSNTTFRMPELAGKQRTDAVNELLRLGLTNTTANVATEEQDSDQAPGTVISTDPPAGETVEKSGQQVKLILAREPPIPVPNVVNQPAELALSLLNESGFQVTSESEASDTVEAGRVTRTDPAAGTEIPRDSPIAMFVSTGPEGVPVPNVVNQPEAQAVAALNQAGFQVFRAEQPVNNPINNGRVVATNPPADTRAPRNSSVTITIGVFEPGGGNNPGGGGGGGGNNGPGGGGGGD